MGPCGAEERSGSPAPHPVLSVSQYDANDKGVREMVRMTKTVDDRSDGRVVWRMRAIITLALVGVCAGGLLTPGTAQAAGCPNEAVRQQQGSDTLPECRGYELVSHFSKQGYLTGPQNQPGEGIISGPASVFAEDGERVAMDSLAAGLGVLGQEQLPFGSYMFLQRSEGGGWSAEPLNPPESQFSDQKLVVADANTGTSLWLVHKADEGIYAGDFYVRSNTGQFKLVGSVTPPSDTPEPASTTMYYALGRAEESDGVVGASSEFTHIVVQANITLGGRFLWPGDTTFRQLVGDEAMKVGSLYEYVGDANPGETEREPVLVGVEGGAGSTALIGECGTALGTLHGEPKNAEPKRKEARNEISEDGNVVFFSPVAADDPVNYYETDCTKKMPEKQELYARIDQSETVDISEPAPNKPCEEDPECVGNASKSADASFEMASGDGSKVFFTSTQQLLPGAHEDTEGGDSAFAYCFKTTPGAGGCNLYEYDFDRPPGERLTLVSAGAPQGAEVQGVIASANDGSHVYFVAKGALTGTERNSAGEEAVEGADNLYVYEPEPAKPGEAAVTFIGMLSPEDARLLWQTEKPQTRVTPDGDFLVFASHARLTTDDESNGEQLFEYDASTKALVRISVSEKVEGKSYATNGNVENGLESPSLDSENGISENGKIVIFGSKAALSPRSFAAFASGCASVYEYSWEGAQSPTEGEVHLVSDGKDIVQENEGACGDSVGGVDASGEDVFFATLDPLTREDGDTLRDVYDARVNGGRLPPAQPAGCVGEGCQQSSSPLAAGGALASELARSGENITASTTPQAKVKQKRTKPKRSMRAPKLAKALKACRRGRSGMRHREICEKRAGRLYGRGK